MSNGKNEELIEIEVIKVNKRIKIPKEIREEIKRMKLFSKLKFMEYELITCPKTKKDQSPLLCLTCEYFVRRVKGKVYCRYKETTSSQ